MTLMYILALAWLVMVPVAVVLVFMTRIGQRRMEEDIAGLSRAVRILQHQIRNLVEARLDAEDARSRQETAGPETETAAPEVPVADPEPAGSCRRISTRPTPVAA